jgi:hypothetical protein
VPASHELAVDWNSAERDESLQERVVGVRLIEQFIGDWLTSSSSLAPSLSFAAFLPETAAERWRAGERYAVRAFTRSSFLLVGQPP